MIKFHFILHCMFQDVVKEVEKHQTTATDHHLMLVMSFSNQTSDQNLALQNEIEVSFNSFLSYSSSLLQHWSFLYAYLNDFLYLCLEKQERGSRIARNCSRIASGKSKIERRNDTLSEIYEKGYD